MQTFAEAVQTFLIEADWLTKAEEPQTVALVRMAEKLDERITATMLAEFRQTFRYLRDLKPEERGETKKDPDYDEDLEPRE